MITNINVATEQLFTALDAYPKLLPVEVAPVRRRRMRILVQRVMATTPPHNGKFQTNAGTGNSEESRMIGVQALAKDLRRIIFAAEEFETFRSRIGKGPQDLMLGGRWVRGVTVTESQSALARAHRHWRNRRGRVSKSATLQIITSEIAFEDYFETQAKRVGLAKAGWLPAFAHFGGMSPAWIARHGMGHGTLQDKEDGDLFLMEAVNNSNSIGSLQTRFITTAVKAEAMAAVRELEKAERSAAFKARLIRDINAS